MMKSFLGFFLMLLFISLTYADNTSTTIPSKNVLKTESLSQPSSADNTKNKNISVNNMLAPNNNIQGNAKIKLSADSTSNNKTATKVLKHWCIQIHYQPTEKQMNMLKEVDQLIKANQYKEARFKFISMFEGSTKHSVNVGDGKRTIGYGFNMSTPYAKAAWKTLFADDPIGDQFELFYNGNKDLSPDQERKIFDYLTDQFSTELDQMGLTKNIMTPHQRITVESLYYNGGKRLIYPDFTNYVISGNHGAAFNQILKTIQMYYHGHAIPLVYGLSNRRLVEAALYAGPEHFEEIALPEQRRQQLFGWLKDCFQQGVNPEGNWGDQNDIFTVNVSGRTQDYNIENVVPADVKQNIIPFNKQLENIDLKIDKTNFLLPFEIEKI